MGAHARVRPGARTITAATVISVSAAAAANGLFGPVAAAGASPRPVSAELTAAVHSLAPAAPVRTATETLHRMAPRIESQLLAVLRLDLAALRGCESSGDYSIDTGNGYYGAYQFDLPTWDSLGYRGLPSEASAAVQDEAAMRLEQQRGWEPWPACSRALGLRPVEFTGPVTVTPAPAHPAPAHPAPAHPAPALRSPAFPGTVLTVALVGERRLDVAVWQARMARRGWLISVDGYFGPQSARVAREFALQKHVVTAHLGGVDAAVWAASWTAPITP